MPVRFVDEPYALILIDDDHAGLHALYHVLRELLHIGEVDAALRGEGLALSRAPREPVREEGGEKKCRAQQTRVSETSIAHEIRKPLGAISHAGQQLAESPQLAEGDVRLTELIRAHSRHMHAIDAND